MGRRERVTAKVCPYKTLGGLWTSIEDFQVLRGPSHEASDPWTSHWTPKTYRQMPSKRPLRRAFWCFSHLKVAEGWPNLLRPSLTMLFASLKVDATSCTKGNGVPKASLRIATDMRLFCARMCFFLSLTGRLLQQNSFANPHSHWHS